MDIMQALGERHQDWLRMAYSMGAGGYSEDVVQEMYIKMYKCSTPLDKIVENGIVNPWYIYRALLSITRDIQRVQSKIVKVSLTDVWPLLQSFDYEQYDHEIDELINEVESHMSGMDFYERKLTELHCREGHSLGKISRGTGISKRSIHYTITHAKANIKAAVEAAQSK